MTLLLALVLATSSALLQQPVGVTKGRTLLSRGAPAHHRRLAASPLRAVTVDAVPPAKKGSVTSGTLNLVKSIVGAGVLALPAGVAAFAEGQRIAMAPAALVMVALGAASAYSFAILGRMCGAAGVETYREAWSEIVGKKSSWVVTSCVTMTPLFACLAYSIILGDSFSSLFGHLLPGMGALDPRRFFVLALGLLLWPLCSLRSLKALAPTSALGTAGVLYTVLFMCLRAVDGSYAAPAFATTTPGVGPNPLVTVLNPKLAILVGTLGTAYMAHFNAASFYADAGKDGKTFNKVVANGFALSVLLNLVVMVAGFLTFGQAASGFILNNYRTSDTLANVARALFGASIAFTFPLAFAGAKDGLRQLDKKLFKATSERRVVALPLAVITALALLLDDVGLVISLSGALMGSAVIYILPAIMLVKAQIPKARLEKKTAPYAMIGVGVLSGVLGVLTSLV
mmetsp:Transcript_24485/g.79110  ORF Transcript_24485/g.79110 Transcript_24485/m.79110 type:complete len:456 (-) Transcript_24485:302-1669(-)